MRRWVSGFDCAVSPPQSAVACKEPDVVVGGLEARNVYTPHVYGASNLALRVGVLTLDGSKNKKIVGRDRGGRCLDAIVHITLLNPPSRAKSLT